MNITIRPADPDRDYARVAEIVQTYERLPVTAETIKEWDSQNKGSINCRCVAVNDEGQIVGYSTVVHHPWMPTELFIIFVITDPLYRKQGIGTQLYDDALKFSREQGAASLSAEVLDSDRDSLRFAEKRGYKIGRHIFESTRDLRLNAFAESAFAGLVESVEATGIRFFSLADAGNTEEALHKLWQVNYQTALEDPGSSGSFPSFEDFQQIVHNAQWFRPEGQILAADGDKYVALAAVGCFADTNSAYNMMTGVLSDYRGHKIAQALKLLTIRVAQRWGVDYIRTNNDSDNAPMLAINRKLGYVPEPGLYRMTKSLRDVEKNGD